MKKIVYALAALAVLALGAPAIASDHMSEAVSATGSNPVSGNPSGVSGGRAQPGTVPGEGNPNSGRDTGTPSVDRGLVGERSGGNSNNPDSR